jgi:hypothetical protein
VGLAEEMEGPVTKLNECIQMVLTLIHYRCMTSL